MLETPDDIGRLQELLDRSAAGAGPHLRGIITGERRLPAVRLGPGLGAHASSGRPASRGRLAGPGLDHGRSSW